MYADNAPAERLNPCLSAAVRDVVRLQLEAGVDIINDGEFGKPMMEEVDYGAWTTYMYTRLSGYEIRETDPDFNPLQVLMGESRDRRDFAEFYQAGLDGTQARHGIYRFPINVGPVAYTGHAQLRRDIDNLKAALGKVPAGDAFITAVATGVQVGPSEYYATDEEYVVAIAEAMREEYKAITAAGLNVQIDDPILVNMYEMHYSISGDMAAFRKWAERHIELVNHGLQGIPEEQVRYHLCWGSWLGPHSTDLPLQAVIDLILRVRASQYSVEAANPQHEHEWKAWKDAGLPDGKAVIPGIVTHKTTILEHPEVVADRIIRYAAVVGRENVIAGTDCGLGGRLHPQLIWAKLKTLAEGARLASEQLWP
jgi:5-methyltetrahydropteroyltriglutamate--homocysteine methyltransferase